MSHFLIVLDIPMIGAIVILLLGAFGLFVFLFVRAITLHRKVADMEFRLDGLERSFRGLADQVRPPEPKPKTSAARPAKREPAVAELTLTSPTAGAREASPAPAVPSLPRPVPAPSRTRAEWEAFVGGRVLNLIGAFALIIGVGFFLKYAFDNNWISEPVRVLIGAVAGLACLWGAQRTHRRGLTIFAQGLVGAGTAILYLSVYASFNFYNLVPQWVAFVLMSLVTALAVGQGLYYNSFAVGVLGWAGGYLTPWMLSTGVPNEAGLFTYVALLTVALLGLTVRKPEWGLLQVLTLFGTWTWYFVWHMGEYDREAFGLTIFFVLVFWGLFAATDALGVRLGAPYSDPRRILTVLNAGAGVLAVWLVASPESETTAGLIALGMAALTAGTVALTRPDAPQIQTTVISSTAAALVVLSFSYLFDEFRLVAGWSVLAAGLAWAARERNWPHFIAGSVIVAGLAAWAQVATPGAMLQFPSAYSPLISERTLGYAAFIAGSFAAWRFIPSDERSRTARGLLLIGATAGLSVLATVELSDTLRAWRDPVTGGLLEYRALVSLLLIAALWVALGAGIIEGGLRYRLLPAWVTGTVLLGLGVCVLVVRGLAVSPAEFHSPVWNVRTATLALTAILTAWIGRRFMAAGDEPGQWKDIATALFIGSAVALFSLLTGEVSDAFRRELAALRIDGVEDSEGRRTALESFRQISMSGVWLVYSATLMVVGFWRSSRGFRLLAIGLFGLSILKIFLYDLSFLETLYRIFSFIGLGVILLAASYLYQRYKDVLLAEK